MSRLLIYIFFNVSLTFSSEVTEDKDLSINQNSAFQFSDVLTKIMFVKLDLYLYLCHHLSDK